MTSIVLVQGAWEGGWYWRPVRQRLQARGHDVFAPSLTGLGDRSHLLTPEVTLDTHIQDIANIFEYEDLTDAVLVGHSYGGMVITGVADRMPERIRTLVYLDAFLPEDGDSITTLARPERQAAIQAAVEAGDGWRIPPNTAEQWGVTEPEDAAWLDRLSGMHPYATMTQPIRLTGAHRKVANRIYILASAYDPSPFQVFAEKARAEGGWEMHAIDCHHFLNVSRPDDVADIVARAAG